VLAVVVDLAGVRFLDSTAIAALVHARNKAAANSATLTVVRPQPPVPRVLEITGMLGGRGCLTDS